LIIIREKAGIGHLLGFFRSHRSPFLSHAYCIDGIRKYGVEQELQRETREDPRGG